MQVYRTTILFVVMLTGILLTSSSVVQGMDQLTPDSEIISTFEQSRLLPTEIGYVNIMWSGINYNNTENSPGGTIEYYETADIEVYDGNLTKVSEISIDDLYEYIWVADVSADYLVVELRNETQKLAVFDYEGNQLWIDEVDDSFEAEYVVSIFNDTLVLNMVRLESTTAKIRLQMLNITSGTVIQDENFSFEMRYDDFGTDDYYLSGFRYSSLIELNNTLQLMTGQTARYYEPYKEEFSAYFVEFGNNLQNITVEEIRADTCETSEEYYNPNDCTFHVSVFPRKVTTSWIENEGIEEDAKVLVIDSQGFEPARFVVPEDFHPIEGFSIFHEDEVTMFNVRPSFDDETETTVMAFNIDTEGNQRLWQETLAYRFDQVVIQPDVLNEKLTVVYPTGDGLDQAEVAIAYDDYTFSLPQSSETTDTPFWYLGTVSLMVIVQLKRRKLLGKGSNL